MITLLTGGTGGVKLLLGLAQVVPQREIAVIVNTAEDMWLPHGYFSPDVDTVLYALSGMLDESRWYGVAGDTFNTHRRLRELGFDEYLNIGDTDRATHILRGELMRRGLTLEQATKRIAEAMGVDAEVLPMSNQPVRTVIRTPQGRMNLQEWLVKHGAKPEVLGVSYEGSGEGCPRCAEAVESSEAVIIGPSNPVTSILPILSLENIARALRRARSRCVAVSPLVRGRPFSGPAHVLMRGAGIHPSSESIARLYREYCSTFVVDTQDAGFEVEGLRVLKAPTLMSTREQRRRLAEFLLEVCGVAH